jgi:hypothetical protein
MMTIREFGRSVCRAMPVFSENLQLAGRSFFGIASSGPEHFLKSSVADAIFFRNF